MPAEAEALITHEDKPNADGELANGGSRQQYALGYKENGEAVGFALGAADGRLQRGIAYFQVTDDISTSNQLISYVRGGGKAGKGGSGPGDALPNA